MLKDSIINLLNMIDDNVNDAQNNTLAAITESYMKQINVLEYCLEEDENINASSIFQEYSSDMIIQESENGIIGVLKKLWKSIVDLLKIMKNKLDQFISNIFGSSDKSKTSIDSIISETLKQENNNKIKSVLSSEKPTVQFPSDKSSSFSETVLKLMDRSFIVNVDKNNKKIVFEMNGIKGEKINYKTDDPEASINITGKSNTFNTEPLLPVHFITNSSDLNKLCDLINSAKSIMETGDKNEQKKFNLNCKLIINFLKINGISFSEKRVEMTLEKVVNFQKILNDMIYTMDRFTDINSDISNLSKETISNMNKLVSFLNMLQFSMNSLTNSINNNELISRRFLGCINKCETLDVFVKLCIDNGIPSKYIAYNTWLVADKRIKGDGKKFKPVWGQTRSILFPPDKKSVYKVAMSGAGITSNLAEVRVSDVIVSSGNSDLIAPVLKSWKNTAVIEQKRIINSDGKTSNIVISQDIKHKLNEVIKKYEASHNKSLRINIIDMHPGNVEYDSEHKTWKCIDYGFSNRK